MKKKVMIAIALAILLIGGCFLFFKEESFTKKQSYIEENLNAYTLKGNMDITKGEDIKKYAIEVGYKKVADEDYFKVSICDKQINQTQIILRNKDGVYVVTPSLNQIFKFEGDWPLNSLKPYLVQSMQEILKSDSCVVEKNEDGYKSVTNVLYPNNPSFKVQEMYFDENGYIRKLYIKDDSDVIQLSIDFTSVNYHADIKDAYFEVPNKMESEVSASYVEEAQLPLYPMQIFDSTLASTKSVQLANGNKHILEYEGDKNFTIVQSLCTQKETTETVIMSGNLVDSIDAFGFYDGNHLQWIKEGVEYTIYSDDLSVEEMAQVLSSMQVVVMK